ncbi:La-related protein 1B [Carex littledalei]|uniref:La-related protein 1B n=1 Tax=Carex littledalei TaxID=544730 RepID=A0A833QLP7_9POAL|nr:La-related protein 1B [Carex littledalei]
MPASYTSAPIVALEPSYQSASTQNLVGEKFADSTESNVGPSKGRKPAWNVPSGKASQELEYVICGAAWPALAANTSSRDSHKSSSTASSSTDDLKSLSDVSAVSVPPETTVVVPVWQQPGPNLNPNLMRQGSTGSENTREPQKNNRSSRWDHGQNRRGYNNNNNHHHHHNNNSGGSYRGHGRESANWNPSWNNSPRPPYFYQGNQAMTTPQPQPAVSYGYGIPNVYPTYYAPTSYDYSHAMYGHVPLIVPQWVAPMVPGYAEVLKLRNSIFKQIEYYFSIDNLVKDTHLRKKMDKQGWVPISFVADFKQVKQMSGDLQFILESLNDSTVVEVQGNKIRRRENWMKMDIATFTAGGNYC